MKVQLAVLISILISSSLNAANWASWLGPERNGISAETLPPIESLKETWAASIGVGELGRRTIFTQNSYCWTPPVVANGKLDLRIHAGRVVCLGGDD
ncbi:MAG: hypothetical protein AAF357_03230 [Verrucomicrobiota bacterium]